MTYKKDAILPMIEAEMKDKLDAFSGLSTEEEGKLLSLTDDQKFIVAEADRKAKNEFLAQAPGVTHGALKMSDQYRSYISMVAAATK
jgi:hypothetical protein